MEPVRFGIISSAWIADKELEAIVKSKFAKLVAVSSRSEEKLKDFIKRNNVDENSVKGFTSYDELIEFKDVEAVYIPIPTSLRLEYVLKAANAGKHIIVEKPFVSAEEVKKMIEACKKNEVYIIDNTMFLHHLRSLEVETKYLTEVNRKKVKRVYSIFNYTNRWYDNIRHNPQLEPDGALGDLGWYCVQGILFAFNECPIDVVCQAERYEETGAILTCQVMLRFKDNKYATFTCSFDETTHQELQIIFSDDLIVNIPNFVIPLHSDIASFQNKIPDEELKLEYSEKTFYTARKKNGVFEKFDVEDCVQVDQLIMNFSRTIRGEKKDISPYAMIERSYECMKVIDAIRKSIASGKVEKL